MRSRTKLAAAAVAVFALGMFPAGANALDDAPLVTDAAGDANGLNSQGNVSTGGNGPSTTPASIVGADLREISFETRYTTTKLLHPDGTVSKILYTPNALKIGITMEGNVLPTFGPSILVRVPTRVVMPSGGLCESWFQAWWKGPNATPNDQERADIRRLTAATCPAANTIFDGFDITIVGKVVTLTYPLSASGMAGFIQNGTEITAPQVFTNSSNYIHSRTAFLVPPNPATGGLTAPSIDEAERFPGFVVGSDVPANIDCSVTPENPECLSP